MKKGVAVYKPAAPDLRMLETPSTRRGISRGSSSSNTRRNKQEARSKKQDARSKTQDARSKKQEARGKTKTPNAKRQTPRPVNIDGLKQK
jgi:hypothetical protein